MKREVIRNFLNLPGIVGVAFIDGQSRPFFASQEHTLNCQQKDALSQGVQQIITTTPPSVDCFEFQFNQYRIYTHKLDQSNVLLVLANEVLEYASYFPCLTMLKLELQGDLKKAIAHFRIAVGNTTLKIQTQHSESSAPGQEKETAATPHSASALPIEEPLSTAQVAQSPEQSNTQKLSPIASTHSIDFPDGVTSIDANPLASTLVQETTQHASQSEEIGNTTNTKDNELQTVSLKEILIALNQFSSTATRYLGATIVSNYWKATRPAIEWLSKFEVDRKGHIAFASSLPSDAPQTLTPEQHQWLREWVAEFIQRCSKVIRNFSSVIQKMDLSPTQRRVLLSE